MRIAIDIRDLKIAKTGSKTYLEELCKAFPVVAPEHEFVFLQPKWKTPARKSNITKIINHLMFYWWKEVELPWLAWRNKCDLIFCTDYVVPLIASCPTVPVFYDANFWANSEQYNRWWRKLMDVFAVPAAKKSPFVVTISEFSCQEIAKYTGIVSEKIKTIPIAPKSVINGNILTLEEADIILKRYGVDLKIPFLLHVGVLEKRKNLPRLIRAFALFLEKSNLTYQLVLVGQPGPKQDLDDSKLIYSTIIELGLNQNVQLIGYVPDQDLVAFYQRASSLVFPSLREGFGIPILEAFNNNIPVIAADSTAIPEVAGDAALLFDPLDIKDIAKAMEKITTRQILRDKLIAQGHQRAALFSWEKTAKKLNTLFEEVVLKR